MTASRLAGVLGTAAVVATALAVGAGALILLGGHKQTRTTGAQQNPRQQLIDLLGPLRRPQTKADLPPTLRARLSHRALLLFNGAPDLPLVRYATVTPWRDRLFLVPLKPLTPASLAAAAHGMKLSPALLARLKERSLFTGEQVSLMSPSGGGDCCFTIAAIKAGNDLQTTEITGPRGYSATRAVAVVPDGVAKVRIVIPAQKLRRSPDVPPGASVTIARTVHLLLPVQNNVIAFEIHQGGAGCCLNAIVTWYAPNGQVIKRISGP